MTYRSINKLTEHFNKEAVKIKRFEFSGNCYQLCFETEQICGEYEWGEYYSHKGKYEWWRGDGKIEDKLSGKVVIFHFSTEEITDHWQNKWYWNNFERLLFHCDGVVRGNSYVNDPNRADHAVLFEPGLSSDPAKVIDYLAELVLQLISDQKTDTILPRVKLPFLKIEELRKMGLLGEEDGQLRISAFG